VSNIKLSKEFIKSTVKLALNEDLYPLGDITSDLIKDNKIIENIKKVSSKLEKYPFVENKINKKISEVNFI